MNKTKIEWTDWTWNPIRGLCPQACLYCYARAMYKRFKWDEKVYIPWRTFFSDAAKINSLRKPSKIFVCSTFELFHPVVSKQDTNSIFNVMGHNPQHTFQILTKLPQNIDRDMPDNVWLGVSITKNEDEWRTDKLLHWGGKIRFLSIEPMLDDCKDIIHSFNDIEWLVIGRLTGHGNKYNPQKEWIKYLIDEAQLSNLPIFLKDNLKDIWEGPLIQEFPE